MTALVVAAISGCTSLHLTSQARREAHWRATTATLTGIVRDSATGLPLNATVYVHAGRHDDIDGTDSVGRFRMPVLDSGAARVEISRRGFITEQRTVLLAVGRTDSVSVALRRATPPCCRLAGRWEVDLTLDSAGHAGAVAGVRQLAAGSVTFGDSQRTLYLHRRDETGQVREELGVSSIDLSPMLGPHFRPGALVHDLRSIGATDVDSTLETTTRASSFHGDSVEIEFVPQVDHAGLFLNGRISGDSIAGRWFQKSYCCGAYGRFVLRRVQ